MTAARRRGTPDKHPDDLGTRLAADPDPLLELVARIAATQSIPEPMSYMGPPERCTRWNARGYDAATLRRAGLGPAQVVGRGG